MTKLVAKTFLRALATLVMVCQVPLPAAAADPDQFPPEFGPIYSQFRLTLDNGDRSEWLGPLFYEESAETSRVWAIPPLVSQATDTSVDSTEFDILYPLLTYDRFGEEYRFQVAQWFSFAGGQTSAQTNTHRFTLFPVYWQQRSEIPERNYTAVVPFYGRLQNRMFRDEVEFVLYPLYVKTKRKDVTTWNMPLPFFHIRRGDELSGWQFWPLFGTEVRSPHTFTNNWGDEELRAGHRKRFVLWPLYHQQEWGLGTTNPVSSTAVFPLFLAERSPNKDMTAFPLPFGYVRTVDREKGFRQWSLPWPFIMFARGEGKTINRVYPIFSRGRTPVLERNSYLWPIYHESHLKSAPLDRKRSRVLIFLYSQAREINTDTGSVRQERFCWPFFWWGRGADGRERLQALALLEPILPRHKAIGRNYSHLWSIWRADRNPEERATSQSLLWNLYRRETRPETKKFSLLFGLFQYQSTPEGRRWRVAYIPFGQGGSETSPPTSDQP